MTKNVRIENADSSSKKIIVEVWGVGDPNKDQDDWLVESITLANPTDMTTKAIWKNRYLVIKELE